MSAPVTYGPPYALAGLEVLVVGLGRSGLAAARLCAREGATVVATDRRAAADLDLALLTGLDVELVLGEHREADFTGADLVILSPGVPLSAPMVQSAVAAGVPVLGEVELAASFLAGVPAIAITGTNGKSTTTALAGRILEVAGLRPFVGGNLGRALSEAALAGEKPRALVLELSSFQLETTRRFHPQVAVVLNLTPDHLDRHGTLEGYAAAKARIFAAQVEGDHAVVNADDPRVAGLADGGQATVHRFGAGDPAPGGCGFTGGELHLDHGDAEAERYRVENPSLRGSHNLANAAAAVLAARYLGVSPEAIQTGLDTFRGLPHRLESVRVRGGVEWVNDSKATNVDSARTALGAFDHGILWIAGGRGKGAPYAPMAALVRGRVKALLGIGEDGEAITAALGDAVAGPVEVPGTLEAAVDRAAELATSGDVVLLSPACASYDQFSDYEARGTRFKRLVEALP